MKGGEMQTLDLPDLTSDVAQASRDICEHGVCFLTGVLSPAQLGRVREALYYAAEQDRLRRRVEKFVADQEGDDSNQRVWNLLSRDPVFVDLAEHDVALGFVREFVGWPALLSNISANITGPGGGEMMLHADQGFTPEPWSDEIQGINVAWCIDDFSDDNGATRIVPGSHRLRRTPQVADQSSPTVPLEAPAGTMIVMEGRLWHKTGFNRSEDQRRAGIFAFYSRPIYRTQENWFLSLDPIVRQYGSDTLLQLLAFKSEGFGLVNGASPQ
jgi:ectoine hydroxylase-related dioxygenase (phytanoyl-CoA dioxygenase family)